MSHRSGKRKRGESPTTDYPSYEIEDSPEAESPRAKKVLTEERYHVAVAREYTYWRQRGLSHAQAGLQVKMAFTKKRPAKKPVGIGARAKAKNAYKTGGITDRQLLKAVKKAENSTLETYYTNWGVQFNTNTAQATGTFSPGGFQAASGAAKNTLANFFGDCTQVHLQHLPAQIQVGTAAGYRKGQHIQPIGFRWWIRGWMQNATAPHDFHFAIIRNKTNILPATVQVYPTAGTLSALNLFEQGAFGPNAGSFLGNQSACETTDATRYDRDAWDIKKTQKFTVTPVASTELNNTNGIYKKLIQHNGYYKFPDKDWDYTLNTGLSIKGGDYYLAMWQQNTEPASAPNGGSPVLFMQVNMELSFKDA